MSEYPLTEKLQELKKKYETLSGQLSEPDVMSDMKKYIQLNREYKELEPIVAAGDKYIKMVGDLEGAKDILAKEKDEDLRELAKEEVSSIEGQLPGMEEEIKLLLIPKDPQDEKNAIVEILCRRPLPHVRQVLRAQGLEAGDQQPVRGRCRRIQGSYLQGVRTGRLRYAQI